MSSIMMRSVMIKITSIQIITTSTTTVQTTTKSTTLIQRTILIILSYVMIKNAVKVLISLKKTANIFHMLFNSFKNLTQISSEENSNTLILEKKHNCTVEYYLCHQWNQHLTLNENYTTNGLCWPSFLL